MINKCSKCNGEIGIDELTGEKFCKSCGFMEYVKSSPSSKPQISSSEQTYAMQIRLQKRIRKGRCNKICHEYKATPLSTKSRYELGLVHCSTCDIFLKREGCLDKNGNIPSKDTLGLICKCCRVQVRTRPRKGFHKEKFIRV